MHLIPRHILLLILLPFAALTAWSLSEVGLIGIFTAHMNPGGAQVFVDLVIALVLVIAWMIQDCRMRGVVAWPWVLATLTLGSFGPLAYLLARRAAAAAPSADERRWA